MNPLIKKVGSSWPTLILTGLLIYQTYSLFSRFLESHTFMESSFVPQTSTTFPEITYCFKSKYKVISTLTSNFAKCTRYLFSKNVPAFQGKYNISHANWKAQITSKEMFEDATFSKVPSIVNYISVRYFQTDLSTGAHTWVFSKNAYSESDSFFKKRSHPLFGQCATMRISDEIQKYGYYFGYIKTYVKRIVLLKAESVKSRVRKKPNL